MRADSESHLYVTRPASETRRILKLLYEWLVLVRREHVGDADVALTFVTQRVSVVLHKAVAAEVRAGCRVGAAETCDVRGKWVGGEVGVGEWEGE